MGIGLRLPPCWARRAWRRPHSDVAGTGAGLGTLRPAWPCHGKPKPGLDKPGQAWASSVRPRGKLRSRPGSRPRQAVAGPGASSGACSGAGLGKQWRAQRQAQEQAREQAQGQATLQESKKPRGRPPFRSPRRPGSAAGHGHQSPPRWRSGSTVPPRFQRSRPAGETAGHAAARCPAGDPGSGRPR